MNINHSVNEPPLQKLSEFFIHVSLPMIHSVYYHGKNK